jgi:subtilisin family serine protease
MKKTFLILLSLLFVGCESDNGCTGTTVDDSIDTTMDINISNMSLEGEPYYWQQWYLHYESTFFAQNKINPNAHINAGNILQTHGGAGVKIAIIDDGLDVTHEDLEGAIINTYDMLTQSTNVSHGTSLGFHGTAVTGIIGARVNNKGIHGIASGSSIIFLKYKEFMSESETIELFTRADAFGADIINCSWGTNDVSQPVKEKIQDLAINGRGGKGTIIVFAAGNSNKDTGNDESSIPEVISVGAIDKDNLRSWYSNYGIHLDVMAPGGAEIGITTLDDMYQDGLASRDENYFLYNDLHRFVGTSASAPIVSGVIALILEQKPNASREEIDVMLQQSSDKIGNLPYVNGRNDFYGYGKINLVNILAL